MRHVDQHSQLVHVPHDALAEIGEASVASLVGGRAGPIVAVVPGERHVAHAPAIQRVEVCERVLDGVAALHAHQHGDVTPRHGPPHFIRVGRQLGDGLRIHQHLHRIDQRHCPSERGARPVARVDPDREERGREAAFLHPREVDVAVRQPRRDVGLHVEHALRRVDVAVEDDRVLEHEQQS